MAADGWNTDAVASEFRSVLANVEPPPSVSSASAEPGSSQVSGPVLLSQTNTNGCPTTDVDGAPFGSHFLSITLDTNFEDAPRRSGAGVRSRLTPKAELLKNRANAEFQKQHHYSNAIALYSQAIHVCPDSPLLYANRAAAYLKRQWDGDVYAALRDCYVALELDSEHVKALFRIARCLHLLAEHQSALKALHVFKTRFPHQSGTSACSVLEVDMKTALFTEKGEAKRKKRQSNDNSNETPPANPDGGPQPSPLDAQLQGNANDYKLRFCGHCNTTTDIKEANFFGRNSEYIVTGSDDGTFFVWCRQTGNIVSVLRGDESIVNCLQPHPTAPLLATSGIESVVKIWSPRPEDGALNEHQVVDVDTTASANQRRMNADPFEVMLYNIGYRMGGVGGDTPPGGDPGGAAPASGAEGGAAGPSVQCRQS